MVVSNSTNLANCRSSFLSAMGQAVLISKEQTSSHDNVAEMISDLKVKNVCTFVWDLSTVSTILLNLHQWSIGYSSGTVLSTLYRTVCRPLPIYVYTLQFAACKLARCLMGAATQVTDHLSIEDTAIQEDLTDTYLATVHACFNLGFEVSNNLSCVRGQFSDISS